MWPKVSALSLVLARHAEPEHVHRRAVVVALQSGFLAHGRMTSVAADHQVGADREPALRRFRAHADDAASLLDEVGRFGLHAQVERAVAPGLLGEEIEEVPLRHQRDEFAAGRQMAEIHHRKRAPRRPERSAFRPSDAAVSGTRRSGPVRSSIRASTDEPCRRGNRGRSPHASPAPRRRRRRARAGSPASFPPDRRRRCSTAWQWSYQPSLFVRAVVFG